MHAWHGPISFSSYIHTLIACISCMHNHACSPMIVGISFSLPFILLYSDQFPSSHNEFLPSSCCELPLSLWTHPPQVERHRGTIAETHHNKPDCFWVVEHRNTAGIYYARAWDTTAKSIEQQHPELPSCLFPMDRQQWPSTYLEWSAGASGGHTKGQQSSYKRP